MIFINDDGITWHEGDGPDGLALLDVEHDAHLVHGALHGPDVPHGESLELHGPLRKKYPKSTQKITQDGGGGWDLGLGLGLGWEKQYATARLQSPLLPSTPKNLLPGIKIFGKSSKSTWDFLELPRKIKPSRKTLKVPFPQPWETSAQQRKQH